MRIQIRSRDARPYGLALAAITALSASNAIAANTLLIAKEVATNGTGNLREINSVSTNLQGGFVTRINYDSNGTAGTGKLMGNLVRGPMAEFRTEGTFGGFAQTSIGGPTLNNAGQLAYSAGGASSASAVFLGDNPLAISSTSIPGGPLSGKFFGSVGSAQLATDGTVRYAGDYRDTASGSQAGRAIFVGDGSSVLLKSGDTISNAGTGSAGSGNVIVFPLVAPDNASVLMDTFSIGGITVSPSGTRYITTVDVGQDTRVPTGGSPAFSTQSPADDELLVSNGLAVTTASGGVAREGNPIPVADGGRSGEVFKSFNSPDINNADSIIYSGYGRVGTDSATDNWFVIHNGLVIAREGGSYAGGTLPDIGLSPQTATNEDGDIAFNWGTTQLYVNNTLALQVGDMIDTDGDGINDTALSSIAGQAFALSERLGDGTVDVYLTLRTAATSTNDLLVRVNVPIPEPTSLAMLASTAALLVRRRRV